MTNPGILVALVCQGAMERLALALLKCSYEGALYFVAGCSPHCAEPTAHADSP